MKLKAGQCGLCVHFGENSPRHNELQQIRKRGEAQPDTKEECGHPTHSSLHLLVTAISGCDAFEAAEKK